MLTRNIFPVPDFGLMRKTILSVLIGLMGGGVAVLAQHRELVDETGIEVCGAPAEFPDVDIGSADTEQRFEFGDRHALVQHVGDPGAPRLSQASRQAEERRRLGVHHGRCASLTGTAVGAPARGFV